MVRLIGRLKDKVRGSKKRPEKQDRTKGAGDKDSIEQTLLPDAKAENPEPRKLVVVGKESVFSREIIDYSIDMAERMGYEIVALNAAPLSCDTFQRSSSRDQICEDFRTLSENNVALFRKTAQSRNILFTHVIKYSESYEVLAELKKEIGEFEFVVSEEEHDPSPEGPPASSGGKSKIFVYSMI